MAVTRTVRVIRTWHFEVDAEYGDNYDSLAAKITEEQLDESAPDAETRVVLEEHDSAYGHFASYVCADCTPEQRCPFHEANPKTVREEDVAAVDEEV